jgi:hypothetical protein
VAPADRDRVSSPADAVLSVSLTVRPDDVDRALREIRGKAKLRTRCSRV